MQISMPSFSSVVKSARTVSQVMGKQAEQIIHSKGNLLTDVFEGVNKAVIDTKAVVVLETIEGAIKNGFKKLTAPMSKEFMAESLKGMHEGIKKGGLLNIITDDVRDGIKTTISKAIADNPVTKFFKPLIKGITDFFVDKMVSVRVVEKSLVSAFLNIGNHIEDKEVKKLFDSIIDELCVKIKNKLSPEDINKLTNPEMIVKMRNGTMEMSSVKSFSNSDINSVVFDTLFKMPPEELSKIVIKGIEGAVKSIISETIGKIPFVKEFALEKFNKFLPELHSKLLKGLKNGSIKKAMDDGSEAFYAKPNIYKALEAVSEQSFKSTMDFIDKKKEQIFPNIPAALLSILVV